MHLSSFTIAAYILLPLHCTVWLLFVRKFIQLTARLDSTKNVKKGTRKARRTKLVAVIMGIVSATCIVTFWVSILTLGPGTLGNIEHNNELRKDGQFIAVTVQSLTYALSAAAVFHICGFWLMIVANMVSSLYRHSSEDSSVEASSNVSETKFRFNLIQGFRRRSVSSSPQKRIVLRHVEQFRPKKWEFVCFILPPWVAFGVVVILVIVRSCTSTDWLTVNLVHRVEFSFFLIPLTSIVLINLRGVMSASSLIKEMVEASQADPHFYGNSQREVILLSLSRRVRNLSLFTTIGALISILIGIGVIVSDAFTSDIFIFTELMIIMVLVAVFWFTTYLNLVSEHNTAHHSVKQRAPSDFHRGSMATAEEEGWRTDDAEYVNILDDNVASHKDGVENMLTNPADQESEPKFEAVYIGQTAADMRDLGQTMVEDKENGAQQLISEPPQEITKEKLGTTKQTRVPSSGNKICSTGSTGTITAMDNGISLPSDDDFSQQAPSQSIHNEVLQNC